MNTTSHSALANCASCYTTRGSIGGVDDNLVSWALDKTGMVDTSLLCNSNENTKQIVLTEQQKRNRVMELGFPEKVLRIHGVAPASKPEGVT